MESCIIRKRGDELRTGCWVEAFLGLISKVQNGFRVINFKTCLRCKASLKANRNIIISLNINIIPDLTASL